MLIFQVDVFSCGVHISAATKSSGEYSVIGFVDSIYSFST